MKIIDWIGVFIGIFGLIGVRFLEDKIFYDPFLPYFHLANKQAVFPNFEWTKLVFSHLFRFVLNLIFSLVVIYFGFKNRSWTLQAAVMIVLVFVLTFPIYLYCLYDRFELGYLFSFYIRRFVIQPMVLLLLLPLFYYRKQILEKNKT